MIKRRLLVDILLVGFVVLMSVFDVTVLFASSRSARPAVAPPQGKTWVKMETGWKIVPAPPSDAPYVYENGHWKKITKIPLGKEWVPSFWGVAGWIPAHWCPVIYPDSNAEWIPGHWEKGDKWIPGHWMGLTEIETRVHRVWIPGHRIPGGAWLHGQWQ